MRPRSSLLTEEAELKGLVIFSRRLRAAGLLTSSPFPGGFDPHNTPETYQLLKARFRELRRPLTLAILARCRQKQENNLVAA